MLAGLNSQKKKTTCYHRIRERTVIGTEIYVSKIFYLS